MRRSTISLFCALAMLPACKTADNAMDGVRSAGSAAANGVTGVATSLVNVNLSNVLNDLALDLKVDKSNIPINAQIPISVAANVCGVSINILSIGGGGGTPRGCTANTASPELVQAVQQQLAAQGSVGGGAQTGGASGAGTGTPTTGTWTSGTTSTTPPAPTTTTTTTTPTGATPQPAPNVNITPGTNPSSPPVTPAPTPAATPTPTPHR